MVVNSQKQNIQDIHQQVEYLQNQAVTKHKAGETAAAVDFYLQAINLAQHQPDWLYGNVITLLGQLEQFEQGLELGNRALSLYPESSDLYRAIGIVCENKEDTLNSIQKYGRAIELEPNQPDWLYCNLSKQLLKTNQFKEAVKISSQGTKLYDNFYPLHYILGKAFAAQEQWDEAILAYQKVQLLNPDWTEIKQKLNQAIYKKSQTERLTNYDKYNSQLASQNVAIKVAETKSAGVNQDLDPDINSLFAQLKKRKLTISSCQDICQEMWQKIQSPKFILDYGCWLSPSIMYLEITVNRDSIFTQTSILVCSEHQYAVGQANLWQISPQQFAGIVCFDLPVYLEDYDCYHVCVNDNNHPSLIEGSISQKSYNLEFIDHLQGKCDRQKNLIRESISRYVIESISQAHKSAAADLLRKLQYFLDIPPVNYVDPNLPFKIFIDQAIPLETDGLFISGWLQDPYQMLEKITAISALGFSLEISQQDIYRLERRDVNKFLQDTRYGCFEGKLGFCTYTKVPSTIRTSLQGMAELHSFRFLIGLKGNIEIEVTPDVSHGDCYHARHEVMQLASTGNVSEAMLANCIAPVATKLQRLCIAQTKIKEVTTIGQPIAKPLVSIIIPLYRRLDFMKVQLATMATDPAIKQCEVIYVLDSPEQEDELKSLLREHSALYQLPMKLVVMEKNSGYAAANNQGAAQARGKYLVLLNSDVFAKTKGWMLEMAKFYASNPKIGVLGAKLIYEDGSLQHAGMFFAQTTFPFWISLHYHKGLPGSFPTAQKTRAVPSVTGACLMIRKELYDQVGGLTSDYIIGDFEDSDLCLKCRELGYESWYFAEATLYHLERQSVPLNTVYNGSVAWQLNARLHHLRWEAQISQLMSFHQ